MATAAVLRLSADPQVVLRNVSWETYEKLLQDLSDCSVPHLTYDHGDLEIVSPTRQHEEFNRTIHSVVETFAVEPNIRIRLLGSTTFKRSDLKQGFEPDSCFYLGSADRIRGKEKIDASDDPPPDLVVEIDVTSSSIPRMPIYAHFGVPEVWQYDGVSFRMWKLKRNAYISLDRSLALPKLTPQLLEDFLSKSREWKDHPRFIRFIRDWLAANR
jgi:Uma2 family endonuclease